jgi:hypothetical protein
MQISGASVGIQITDILISFEYKIIFFVSNSNSWVFFKDLAMGLHGFIIHVYKSLIMDSFFNGPSWKCGPGQLGREKVKAFIFLLCSSITWLE